MRRACALWVLAALVACGPGEGPERECRGGTLWSSETGACAAVEQEPVDLGLADAAVPPRLSTLRAERQAWLVGGERGGGAEGEGRPVPGGLGSGTLYQPGGLRVTTGSTLSTHMIVYPGGIATSSDPVYNGYTFTSATNRTELGLEVVGIYYGSGAGSGALGVFDWSCSPADPCSTPSGSQVQPSWIWTRPLSALSCYYQMADDGGGHRHQQLYYRNAATLSEASVTPPRWTNAAYLWNYCRSRWDAVYSHAFGATQRDCSLDNACGWWGPILETFIPDPQPPFKELGYVGSSLLHDGISSQLGPDETTWVAPVPNLKLFHLLPNRGWGVGNVTRN
jgi:hypothetical protein